MTEAKKFAIILKLGAEKYHKEHPTNPYPYQYNMPIDKMHGISIGNFIRIKIKDNNLVSFTLRIEAENVLEELESGYRDNIAVYMQTTEGPNTIEGYTNFVTDVFEKLEKLKYNKFKGIFEMKITNAETPAIFKHIAKLSHIEMAYSECCVCYDDTMVKTGCRLFLCIGCWDKIKPTRDEDEDPDEYKEPYIHCPMCKQDPSWNR